ncbi:DUF4037 domain-containing protein [Bifidobacterium magnum]|uniref:DUF4037 domain-containing protein n=1 Tax=Bifidobacterium magnum TaxID=1692 RepID=A0A087BAD8_9BIFI|nr:DUF4037 domain-containing protein [Bifidobacterium magnum]KFI67988.1 hypothetical protein BMAGN_1580 [Bifidobacterium magnum]
MEDTVFNNVVRAFAALPEVEAIALGGSRVTSQFDASSDYDLYIYVAHPIDVDIRRDLLRQYCSYIELDNQYWETEDDCVLANGIPIDILYRNLADISSQVEQVKHGLAYNGYTTCVWNNIVTSKVLYDAEGKYTALKESLEIPYPETLRKNIIEKNRNLLSGQLPSYDQQIRKAVQRQDLPSVSHRTAAFIESYFDILFALNRMFHPGEKRMMEKLRNAPLLPDQFEENLRTLFATEFTDPDAFLQTLQQIIDNLDRLLEQDRVNE